MKCLIVFAAVAAVASAGVIAAPFSTLVRAPAFDSAVIKSDRLGGNFAYSTIESHAYAHHTPIIQHVASPVAVSYSVPALPAYYPGYLAHPGFYAPQLVAAAPVADAAPAAAPEAPKEEVAAVVEEVVATEAPVAAPVEEVAAPVESTAAPTDAAPAAAPASDDTVAVEAA